MMQQLGLAENAFVRSRGYDSYDETQSTSTGSSAPGMLNSGSALDVSTNMQA